MHELEMPANSLTTGIVRIRMHDGHMLEQILEQIPTPLYQVLNLHF